MKPFYSNKKKIEPQLSDDWEIIYQNETSVTLYSESLNQEILNVPAIIILKFINDNNYELKKNKISGVFSVNTGKLLMNPENHYNDELKKDKEEFINYDDLEIGKSYIDHKGKKFTYL